MSTGQGKPLCATCSRSSASPPARNGRRSAVSQVAGNCCATPTRIADHDADCFSDRRNRPPPRVYLFDPLSQISESWVKVNFIPAEQHDTPALSDIPVAELQAADTIVIGTPARSEIEFPSDVLGFVGVTKVKTTATGRSAHHAGLGLGSDGWSRRPTGQGPPRPAPGGAGDDFARPLSPRASRPRWHTGLAWSRRPSHASQPVRAVTSRPAPKHPSSARNDPENAA